MFERNNKTDRRLRARRAKEKDKHKNGRADQEVMAFLTTRRQNGLIPV